MRATRISALSSTAPHRARSCQVALGLLALAAPFTIACGSLNLPAGADDGGGVAANDGGTTNEGSFTTGDGGGGSDAAPAEAIVHPVAGTVASTFAGSGVAGSADGNGAAALFSNPTGVTLDAQGNLRVTEYDGGRIRTITPSGDVATLTSQANFVRPFAIVISSDGTSVVQTDNDVNGAKTDTSGTLWKVASGGVATPLVEGLGRPRGLGAFANGTLAVVDQQNHIVQILNVSTAQMTTLAGSSGEHGFVDGVGSAARFDTPYGAAVLGNGSIIVADFGNNRLRAIAPDGTVTTFAGNGTAGMVDGPRLTAQLNAPRAVAADAAGNVYFSDVGNRRIRRVNAAGEVETVAGDGTAGFMDGDGQSARFYGQEGIAVTPNGKILYVADGNLGEGNVPYHRVRKITLP